MKSFDPTITAAARMSRQSERIAQLEVPIALKSDATAVNDIAIACIGMSRAVSRSSMVGA